MPFIRTKLFSFTKKIGMMILGVCIALLPLEAGYMQMPILLLTVFAAGQTILFLLYLFWKDEQAEIPVSFYAVPVLMLAFVLIQGIRKEEILPAVIMFISVLAAAGYTGMEQCVLIHKEEQKNNGETTEKSMSRQNAFVGLYGVSLALSAGMVYVCAFDETKGNLPVIYFVVGVFINLFLHMILSQRAKRKISGSDGISKWKQPLIVPKTVGVGWTFNFENLLSYIILGIVLIFCIAALV